MLRLFSHSRGSMLRRNLTLIVFGLNLIDTFVVVLCTTTTTTKNSINDKSVDDEMAKYLKRFKKSPNIQTQQQDLSTDFNYVSEKTINDGPDNVQNYAHENIRDGRENMPDGHEHVQNDGRENVQHDGHERAPPDGHGNVPGGHENVPTDGHHSPPISIFDTYGKTSKTFCDHVPWQNKQSSPDKENLVWTESAVKLFDLINFSKSGYNKYEAPGQVSGVTTQVNVGFYIESMSTFRAQSMDFEVDTYLATSWTDPRLKHTCTHPILITDMEVASGLWQPDLYFVNSKFGFIHQVTAPNFMILVYSDGFVFKSTRINVILSCLLKLQDFPMDEQECSAHIQSFAYVQNVVNLSWHVDEDSSKGFPISYNPKLKKGLSDMDLVDRKGDRCDDAYPFFRGFGNWSCLRATIIMKRKLQYHLIQIFLPTAMLVCISWLSFWLDIRASPARISLTITTLLTLTTMSNGSRQDLPQVSYMKSIDRWVTACQAFVFGVLLEYTIVNFFTGYKTTRCTIHMREHTFKNDGHQKGAIITSDRKSCLTCAARYESYAKRVDRVARALFPLGFVIFNIGYWCSYYDQLQYYITADDGNSG